MNEPSNGHMVADTQTQDAPNRHERRRAAKKVPLAVNAGISAEPAQFSAEWWKLVIANNEQLAAEKLSEYNQLLGAVSFARQALELAQKQAAQE
jgi:hypothetical protein